MTGNDQFWMLTAVLGDLERGQRIHWIGIREDCVITLFFFVRVSRTQISKRAHSTVGSEVAKQLVDNVSLRISGSQTSSSRVQQRP